MGGTRPDSIRWFERLYLGSLLLIALVLLIFFALTGGEIFRSGGFSPALLLLVLALIWGLPLALTLLISRRRSNAAKWALILLFAIGFLLNLTDSEFRMDVVTLVLMAIQGAALGLLFTTSARTWLAGEARSLPSEAELEQTFE